MNVLLSWSKDQSKAVASAFYEWLPAVVPGIEPWMSSKDISKGREWFRELQDVLENTRICIICLTPENVRSPWIYYETGAIATNGPDVLICPYLLGFSPPMLDDGPLGKWQCTVATYDDTWELIKSLNNNALDEKYDLAILKDNFQTHWPDFAKRIEPLLDVESKDADEFITTDADQLAGFNLSSEARIMILEISKDQHGLLLYTQSSGGSSFQVGGRNLCSDQSPRTVAKWEGALDDLDAYGILKPRGYEGQVFSLTDLGFKIADILEAKTKT